MQGEAGRESFREFEEMNVQERLEYLEKEGPKSTSESQQRYNTWMRIAGKQLRSLNRK